MPSPADAGIRVSNAVRLSTHFNELVKRLAADPQIETPEWLIESTLHLLKGEGRIARDFNRTALMRKVATIVLGDIIAEGSLPLWVRTSEGEECVDWSALGRVNQETLAVGYHITPDGSVSPLGDMSLWVKANDWSTVLREARWEARFGKSGLPRQPGRPNQSNEAICLYQRRLQDQTVLQNRRAEAKAIHLILAEQHRQDPDWTLTASSIERALRDYRRQRPDKFLQK